MTNRIPRRASCPDCNADAIPVVWGKPVARALRAGDLGLVRVGGCIVRGSPDSTWWCSSCATSFTGPSTAGAVQAAYEAVTGET